MKFDHGWYSAKKFKGPARAGLGRPPALASPTRLGFRPGLRLKLGGSFFRFCRQERGRINVLQNGACQVVASESSSRLLSAPLELGNNADHHLDALDGKLAHGGL
jgi:hypothetical protein